MNDGKLSEAAFKRSVLPGVKRINGMRDSSFCMRTAVVTGNERYAAYLAAARAINALAAVPAKLESVAVSISLPENFDEDIKRFADGPSKDVTENAVKEVMTELEKALACHEVFIADIACEATKNSEITVSVTACGERIEAQRPALKNLVMVGYTGAAGSAMLSLNHRDALRTRYTGAFLAASDALLDTIDTEKKMAAVFETENYRTYMKPVSDSGVFGAIWLLCEGLDCGCEVDIKRVPIKQATVEVSEFYDINPYELRGDGAFIYVTDKEQDEINEGIVIGHLTDSADRVILNGEIRSFLTPLKEDSYFNCK